MHSGHREARRIVVSLPAGGDGPISGSLRDESGSHRRFTGWIELISALQRLLDEGLRRPGCDAAGPETKG